MSFINFNRQHQSNLRLVCQAVQLLLNVFRLRDEFVGKVLHETKELPRKNMIFEYDKEY